MRIRRYGTEGPVVIVLHGGPGAAGYMAPIARGLADTFRVLEPFQRGSGEERLTVTDHIADLHEVVQQHCDNQRPALVGSSWGAMHALAYAAAYPHNAGSLVLIGCGTFDRAARQRLDATLDERMDETLRRRLAHLADEFPAPDERLRAMGDLILPVYSCALVTTDQEIEAYDARAHHETWQDMMRLQDEGVYPLAFTAINVPVLMLHGTADPHPGQMVRGSLQPHIPQLEYFEWEECGHYPWLEKAARREFFAVLRAWLTRQSMHTTR